jgi:hypothetical protein
MLASQSHQQEYGMSDDSSDRGSNGQFVKGNRGGPGRPRSAVSRGSVALDELGAEAGQRVFQVMLDKALAGDTRAADLLLSRIWPARRGRPVEIDTAPLRTAPDYVPAATGVVNAVMRGEMTPHEGQALSRMLDTQLSTLVAEEFERRLRELEAGRKGPEKEQTLGELLTGPSSTDRTTVFDGFSGGKNDEKD